MNEIEKARMAIFYDEIITEKNKIIILLQKRINELEATYTRKTIEELRREFEELSHIKKILCRNVVRYCKHTNWYYSDNKTIEDFLDGAWYMFQELKK